MTTATSTLERSTRPSFRSLAIAGLVTILVGIAANLITRFILLAVMDLPEEFLPLMPGPVIFFTTLGLFLATVAYAIVTRLSKTPARTFTIVALAALFISIMPNLNGMTDPAAVPIPSPGATSAAFAALIVFHIVAAVVAIIMLPRLAR